jgi:capsular exopolysaccharide synthesis family protein
MKSNLISVTDPRAGATEQYRILRTNLQFMKVEEKIKKIVVTSTRPSEGKTTIAGNLGATLAMAGSKVVIVDCDLRKPSIQKLFNKTSSRGLTNYFTGDDKDIEKLIQNTEVEGLSIVTSGPIPPNPSELLTSLKMKEFISRISEDFDYVILDSPPSAAITDAAVLSTYCDSVIYVCASGQISRGEAKKSIDAFRNIYKGTFGVVLNKIPSGQSRYGSYDYYTYGDKEE